MRYIASRAVTRPWIYFGEAPEAQLRSERHFEKWSSGFRKNWCSNKKLSRGTRWFANANLLSGVLASVLARDPAHLQNISGRNAPLPNFPAAYSPLPQRCAALPGGSPPGFFTSAVRQ
jgi:hypothetical protein